MSYPILTRTMINDLIPNRKFNLIIIFGLSLLFLYIIKAILKYFFDYYGHMVGTGIQKDMRAQLFAVHRGTLDMPARTACAPW